MAAPAIQIRVRMPRFWLEATLQFQYLRPGLHERDILRAGNDPEPAMPNPQPVDDNAVIPVHDLQEQQCLDVSRPEGMDSVPSP